MPSHIYPGVSTIEQLFGSRLRSFTNYHLNLGVTHDKIMSLLQGRYPDTPEQIIDSALSLVRQSRQVASAAPPEGGPASQNIPQAPVLPGGTGCEVEVEIFWTDEATGEDFSLRTTITSDTMPTWSEIYALAREDMPPGRTFYWHGELLQVGENISDLRVIPLSIWGNC